MMRARTTVTLVSMCLLALFSACSEEVPENTLLTTTFAIDAPGGDGGSQVLRDENGIFDLQAFPAFVAISLTAADMDRVTGIWPATAAEFSPGEQTVELVVDVVPGAERQVHLTIFLFLQDRPHCFMEEKPYFIDLSPGSTPTLDILPGNTGDGTVTGSTPANASEVWLLDAKTMVRLDRTMVENLQFEFAHACAHRELTLAWLDKDGGFHVDPQAVFTIKPADKLHDLTLPE